MTKAIFLNTVLVIDPDTKVAVEVDMYKEEGGGIFGVDKSYIATEEPVTSPFGNGRVKIIE